MNSVSRHKEGAMKSANRYKEETMKGFNRYAVCSLRAVLAVTVVMTGIIRSNDYLSRAEPTAFAAEQPAPGALQWRQTSGPEGASVISMLSVGQNLYAGTTVSGVFRSTNQGESWTPINEGLLSPSIQSLAAVGTNIFAATVGGGVFLSTDQGESWQAVNEGLTSLGVRALAVAGGRLFAGTFGSGVFVTDVTQ